MPAPEVHVFDEVARALRSCGSRPDFLRSTSAEKLHDELWAKIVRSKAEVLSLDVFDTLLLRNNKCEATRFFELADHICKKLADEQRPMRQASEFTPIPEDVMLARVQGLKTSYRTRRSVQGIREGNLGEVIAMSVSALGLPKETHDLFRQIEIEYEQSSVSANKLLVSIAAKFTDLGGRVILVSDMYMDATAIAILIASVMPGFRYDRLYSSADIGVTKRSGRLYNHIARYLQLKPSQFFHVGDNRVGDIEQARKSGWNAAHFPISRKELEMREADLTSFIQIMDDRGLDVRDWAKL